MLEELQDIIESRRDVSPERSYTSKLLHHEKGINGILEKIGEETIEVILSAKNGNREEVIYETADLLYHLLVLLSKLNIRIEEVYDELRRRRK